MVAGAVATAAVGLGAGLLGGAALTNAVPATCSRSAPTAAPAPGPRPRVPVAAAAITAAATLAVATLATATLQARRAFRGDAVGRLRG